MKKVGCMLLFNLVLCSAYGFPQGLSSRVNNMQGQAAQYFLGSQDQVLMQINVWGFVNQPGQYMVPYDTDLISLLSYAGGPGEDAKIKKIKVVRASQNGNPDENQVIEVDVKKFINSADPSIIPMLKPGDTVVVTGTTIHFMRNFFEFMWRVAVIAQAYAMFDFYIDR